MGVPFDPYHKWLGIAPKDQPPNHYRLLAIDLFESDPDVIDGAADQRMTFLRTCANGPNVAHSQELLNEIAAARLCLLNPEAKAAYDANLKRTDASTGEQSAARGQVPEAVRSNFKLVGACFAIAVTVLLAISLTWLKLTPGPIPSSPSGSAAAPGTTPAAKSMRHVIPVADSAATDVSVPKDATADALDPTPDSAKLVAKSEGADQSAESIPAEAVSTPTPTAANPVAKGESRAPSIEVAEKVETTAPATAPEGEQEAQTPAAKVQMVEPSIRPPGVVPTGKEPVIAKQPGTQTLPVPVGLPIPRAQSAQSGQVGSLSGTWVSAKTGALFRIADDPEGIEIRLIKSDTLATLQSKAIRVDGTIKINSWKVTFKSLPHRVINGQNYKLYVIDPNTLKVDGEHISMRNGRIMREREEFIWTRQEKPD